MTISHEVIDYLQKIQLSEEDFTFFILMPYIDAHCPNLDLRTLDMIKEVDAVKDALLDLFDVIKAIDLNTQF